MGRHACSQSNATRLQRDNYIDYNSNEINTALEINRLKEGYYFVYRREKGEYILYVYTRIKKVSYLLLLTYPYPYTPYIHPFCSLFTVCPTGPNTYCPRWVP